MAITFVAAGTPVGIYQAGTTALATGIPSVIDDDFLLLLSGRTDDAGAYNALSGWTSIPQHHMADSNSGDRASGVFYKIASSEGSSVNVTHTDTAGAGIGAVILAWRGVDTTTPLDVTPVGDATQFNVDDCTPPAITTASNNSLVVCWAMPRAYSVQYGSSTPPTGFTERLDANLADFRISVSEYLQAMAGTVTPDAVVTADGATNINDWLTGTLALRAAVTGGGGGGVPQMMMGNNLGRSLINGGQIR